MATKPTKTAYGTMDSDKTKLVKRQKRPKTSQRGKKKKRPEDEIIKVRHEKKPSEKLYFTDGKRRVDYVLVWEETLSTEGEEQRSSTQRMTYRKKFLDNLELAKVEMEEDIEVKNKSRLHFIKVHIPWEVMCVRAEELGFRAPLQGHPNPPSNFTGNILKTLRLPNLMNQVVPNQPLQYDTCQFQTSKLQLYMGYENKDTYFTTVQRHQVAYEILATILYGQRSKAEVGIDRLLQEDAFCAAYPLHDGPYEATPEQQATPANLNNRQILYYFWARWTRFFKYQPVDLIREYYGEKIAFYFAWLGMYTAWLFPAALLGLLVFGVGFIGMNNNRPSVDVCQSNETYRMCPLCDEISGCHYWYLSDACLLTKLSYLFDHPGTVVFAIFISFWAVIFLENWKRKNAVLAYRWDASDLQEEYERPRPEFAALCSQTEPNPVTGVLEPVFPARRRLPRIIVGFSFVLMMIVVVLIFIIAVITYRVLIAVPFYKNPLLSSRASLFATTTASVVNFVIILCLDQVYSAVAVKLTEWGMHRSQSEFENQLILKVFIFQFINFYSSIFYIGFFKGRIVGYPGNYVKFFGMRSEECANGNCLMELAQQLAIIMIGKQIISNIQEVFIPKLKTLYHRYKKGLSIIKSDDQDVKQWSDDFQLIEYEGLMDEYMEMVLQYGFVTIFVSAFPVAPFLAMINNWMEIRLDASKLVCHTRRPVAQRAQDIGIWFSILEFLTQVAVICNAFLIAFTSEFLQKIIYQIKYHSSLEGYVNFTLAYSPRNSTSMECRYRAYRDRDGNFTEFYWFFTAIRLCFVVVFEHVVFFVARLLDMMIPDVPERVEIALKRRQYLAKKALLDSSTVNPAYQTSPA